MHVARWRIETFISNAPRAAARVSRLRGLRLRSATNSLAVDRAGAPLGWGPELAGHETTPLIVTPPG
ncbi:MAG: hypothetical protein R2715_24340 [Ilumatobacteraceae bacterium]